MIVVNSSTRQFNIPGADLVFGVTADSGSERKYFQCPRYVGNNLDIAGSFVRMNYRNANGEIDEYLVEDVAVDGDNVTFSWELSPKVTMYKGNVSFVMCVVGPDTKVKWHTTLGRGQVLEGLEPDNAIVEEGTADVVAQLIAMVEAQTEAVEKVGADQVAVVKAAAKTAETASVAEIEAKGVNVRESIPDDYTALSEAVDTLTRGRAGAIVCEAAGESVVVSDASDLPMQGLKIFGRSTQDGTPTPDAPVEIVSVENPVVTVAGKNLFPSRTVGSFSRNGVTYTHNENGSIMISGEASGGSSYSDWIFGSERPENTEVRISFGDSVIAFANPENYVEGVRITLFFEDLSTINLASSPKTIPAGSVMIGARIRVTDGTAVSQMTFYPQIEFGSVATEYEPYSGQTLTTTHTLPGIPVTSGGNYTDSNGQQWICDEVDLERGVYVRRVYPVVYDGTETWNVGSDGKMAKSFPYPKANIGVRFCSHYPYEVADGGYWFGSVINVWDSVRGTSTEAWKAWLAEQYAAGTPLTIQYALATPIETTLSETEIAAYRALHSNYPNTTVLNDSGAHMVVKYAADTKQYIDNKITALIGG